MTQVSYEFTTIDKFEIVGDESSISLLHKIYLRRQKVITRFFFIEYPHMFTTVHRHISIHQSTITKVEVIITIFK